jgi:hypothetical protein
MKRGERNAPGHPLSRRERTEVRVLDLIPLILTFSHKGRGDRISATGDGTSVIDP